MAREVALERELDEAHKKLIATRQEKQALEMSVKELQSQLAEGEKPDFQMDSLNKSFASTMLKHDLSTLETSLKREKQLEVMVRFTFFISFCAP